jgi:flagellin
MALGLLANINSLEVRTPLVSRASIMTANFAKVVESSTVAAMDERAPTGAGATRAQMRPYLIAERNAFGAISMATTAHEALGDMGNILERMRSLVAAGAEGALAPGGLNSMRDEYGELRAAIDTLRQETTYNGADLLGPNAQAVTFDLGPSGANGDQLQLNFSHFSWDAPPAAVIGSRDRGAAERALASIDDALAATLTQRVELGSALKKIETTTQLIQTRRLNSAAANSRVRDVAVAEEMARLSGDLVVRQPGVSVLGQSEQLPQMSMGLLR